jgi:Ca2+/Na+ antiporter
MLGRSSPVLFIALPLILSAYTHLWNPIGFPAVWVVEGQYVQRAMQVLEGEGLHEPRNIFAHFYDHPFFGQIFLAGMLAATDYPSSPTKTSSISINSIEMLYLVPRLFMGILAVIDTFLVYKISEYRYNRNVALIASILFAVMPATWILRKILLESLLLPLLLSSILFAVYYSSRKKSNPSTTVNYTKRNLDQEVKARNNSTSMVLPLISGIFLGLAIFIKIPILTMTSLVGYLITSRRCNRSWRSLGAWVVPVILIPMIWPIYAILVGDFDQLLEDLMWNTQRGEIQLDSAVSGILVNSLKYIFQIDPVILVLGIAGIIFSEIKRDSFILLWAIPIIIFLFLINFVSFFHLIPLLPLFCIAAAKMMIDLSNRIKNVKVRKILPFATISAIGIFGLISTTMLITSNVTSSYFKVYSFLVLYLANQIGLDNPDDPTDKDDKIAIVGRHWTQSFYWIPKYVLDLNLDFKKINKADDINGSINDKERSLIIVDRSMRESFFPGKEISNKTETNTPSYFLIPIATFNNDNPDHAYIYPYTSMSENRDIQWVQIREVNFFTSNLSSLN